MAATLVGSTPPNFGIPSAEQGLKTHVVEVVTDSETKELKDHTGEVVNAAIYNRTSEVTIEGSGVAGSSVDSPGDALTLAVNNAAIFTGTLVVGAFFVQQITTRMENEEFVKTTFKGKAWDAIAS